MRSPRGIRAQAQSRDRLRSHASLHMRTAEGERMTRYVSVMVEGATAGLLPNQVSVAVLHMAVSFAWRWLGSEGRGIVLAQPWRAQ